MAGNFWLSSHFQQWVFDKEEISTERQYDLKFLTPEEYQKLHIFFAHFIQSLGEHLKLRQQVIATASIYFKRFYAKYSLKAIDPLLLAPTCVFLAAKVEESGPISNGRLLAACTSVLWSKFSFAFPSDYPYRINQILECEFYLLEIMDCCLIVWHPYRPLTKYIADMGQKEALLPIAWRICNDSLRTDICLKYPPYLIALTAIYMACVIQQSDCKQWFAELTIDLSKIMEITQEILALYDLWKTYDEKKEIPSILLKMPKPKSGPNSRPASATPRQHTPSPIPPSNLH